MKHKHAKEIHAWADGAEIECRVCSQWVADELPIWNEYTSYRIKPSEPEKPEVPLIKGYELVEIYERNHRLYFDFGGQKEWVLYTAPSIADFAGYVYEDYEGIYESPSKIVEALHITGAGEYIRSPLEILRPKFVAFRKEESK